MKLITAALTTFIALSAFAIDGTLDGMTFCRDVRTGVNLGRPAGESRHCVSFEGGRARDTSSSFFGNPPQSFTYELVGDEIVNLDTNESSGYILSGTDLVIKETGAVLTLVR